MSDAAMIVAGAIACLGLSGAGSALGTGLAASAAVGAWKKCYAANKPAPFLLLSFVGAPITQTLYGMILMFTMLGKVADPAKIPAGAGVPVTSTVRVMYSMISTTRLTSSVGLVNSGTSPMVMLPSDLG